MPSALITGGSSGIGLAIASGLRDDGYELTLVARRPEPLEEAAAQLQALAVPANLGDADECVRVVAAHAERYGGMDVLVNSAGIGVGGAFAEQETKKIALQLDVNLRATLVITRESLQHLRVSRGQVITLASIAGTIPTPGLAVYGATKAALIAWTTSLQAGWRTLSCRPPQNRAHLLCRGWSICMVESWTRCVRCSAREICSVALISSQILTYESTSPSTLPPPVASTNYSAMPYFLSTPAPPNFCAF